MTSPRVGPEAKTRALYRAYPTLNPATTVQVCTVVKATATCAAGICRAATTHPSRYWSRQSMSCWRNPRWIPWARVRFLDAQP